MSQRRLAGGPQRLASEASSLHRCAIPFCSNPAVADNVCELHHSNNGRSTGATAPRGAASYSRVAAMPSSHSMPDDRWDDASSDRDRFRRVSPGNVAATAAPRVAKKQRTSNDAMPTNMRGMSRQFGSLTHENLHQMETAFGSHTSSSSMYDDSPYLQDARQQDRSNTGSVQSESEHSGDADRETNLRRERNRIAARKSRQRKLDRISNLEEEKQRLEKHRDQLVQEIRSLEKRDSGVASNAVMTVTDKEYAELQRLRMEIIEAVEDAYNHGDIMSTLQFFRDDSIVSGPQNSSVHLRGKDAMVLDYLCTTYLFDQIIVRHVKVDSGGPRSQHFRVHWQFSGIVKSAGVSMNKDFLELIESVKGKRVSIEGVSNFSFSGDKIVYVHRTADQAKFLSGLLALSKQ